MLGVRWPTPAASELARPGQARKALLVLSDMPAGWTTTKNANTGNSTLGDAQLAHCIGVPASLVPVNPPSVNSPGVHRADQVTMLVEDNVTVYSSAAENPATEYALGQNPKTAGCMTRLASAQLKTEALRQDAEGDAPLRRPAR